MKNKLFVMVVAVFLFLVSVMPVVASDPSFIGPPVPVKTETVKPFGQVTATPIKTVKVDPTQSFARFTPTPTSIKIEPTNSFSKPTPFGWDR